MGSRSRVLTHHRAPSGGRSFPRRGPGERSPSHDLTTQVRTGSGLQKRGREPWWFRATDLRLVEAALPAPRKRSDPRQRFLHVRTAERASHPRANWLLTWRHSVGAEGVEPSTSAL